MSNAICQGLRSPIRRLAGLKKAHPISTSIVHNETILVKNNQDFYNKVRTLFSYTFSKYLMFSSIYKLVVVQWSKFLSNYVFHFLAFYNLPFKL